MGKEALNAQQEHWEETFAEKPEMFGLEPSYPARKAVEIFKKEGKKKILELGAGRGGIPSSFPKTALKFTPWITVKPGLKRSPKRRRIWDYQI